MLYPLIVFNIIITYLLLKQKRTKIINEQSLIHVNNIKKNILYIYLNNNNIIINIHNIHNKITQNDLYTSNFYLYHYSDYYDTNHNIYINKIIRINNSEIIKKTYINYIINNINPSLHSSHSKKISKCAILYIQHFQIKKINNKQKLIVCYNNISYFIYKDNLFLIYLHKKNIQYKKYLYCTYYTNIKKINCMSHYKNILYIL